ncbi:MAG: DMT family transporter [Anaerohalosphaera sp.]|nr:DMT family transporter [Anaerohalosphaera sp.]
MLKKTFRADLLLLIAAFIWGTGFVAQRSGMQYVGPMTFTGLRFLLGGIVLLPVLGHQHIYKLGEKNESGNLFWWSCLAGAMLFCGAALQQIGLVTTEAGKAGFITGLYVVIVALIGIFLGHKIGLGVWAGIALAVLGMYLLSVKESLTIAKGDMFVLGGAFFWAVHVQLLGYITKRVNPLSLACIQFFACGAISMCVAMFTEEITFTNIRLGWLPIFYGGAMSVGIAFSLQAVSQRTCPPAHAAIIMSFEAVFAAIAGGIVLHEMLSGRDIVGCGLMLAGMLAVQLIPLMRKKR